MTDEEKITETEKTREKYFYIDKEKTYQALTGIAISFIGAGLALVVFAALHKPPVPPCHRGFNRPMPCTMRMMPEQGRPDKMLPPRGKFQGPREFRGHKDFRKGKFFPPKNFDRVPAPIPPVPENATPKK